MAAVVIISFVRIITGFVQIRWKRQFIYWISIFLLSDTWLEGLGIPIPMFRLYIFLMALASMALFFQWAREIGRSGQTGFIRWVLRSGALFFVFVLITETWGKTRILIPLCISLILTISIILVFMMLLYILHGFIELALRSTAIPRKIRLYEEEVDIAVRRTVQFMHVVIWGFVLLPAILVIWGAHSNLKDALAGMLSLGFDLAGFRVSVNLLLIAAGVLYGSVLLSWILRKMLMDNLLLGSRAEMGVRNAIGQLLHYFIVLIAFLLAISVIGFDVTKLTIIMSAFGVGIGFGLQSIVNNFVSGLILLFERPIRVGDSIELDGQWAETKRIGLRATTVQTFDQADVIIPNADLITQRVTNWTLTSRQVRLIVPVGVAYGSDVPLVLAKLTACGKSNKMVAETPPPQVLFLSFGESSLDFELRVWVEAENRLNVRNDLHLEIEKSFREANIEIAFPQRDLHIRSIDKSISLRAGETPAV
jgi:small-conductance mechanosensitive channel